MQIDVDDSYIVVHVFVVHVFVIRISLDTLYFLKKILELCENKLLIIVDKDNGIERV